MSLQGCHGNVVKHKIVYMYMYNRCLTVGKWHKMHG